MKTEVKVILMCSALLTACAVAVGTVMWSNRPRWVKDDYGARSTHSLHGYAHASWTKLPMAMSIFEMDTGKPVTQLSDLLTDPGFAGWDGPYASSLVDMWGTPVRLETDGDVRFVLSAGRDKLFGTDDDATVK